MSINRRLTPKRILEKEAGKKLDYVLLPAAHKVLIMEFLLCEPLEELHKYNTGSYPSFIANCAHLLIHGEMAQFTNVLDFYRKMEREDANT